MKDEQQIYHAYKKKANPAAAKPISPLIPWIETLAPALLTTSEDVVAGLEVVAVPFATATGGIEARVLPGLDATRIPVLVMEIEGAMLVLV
jgi:hypothetical protein